MGGSRVCAVRRWTLEQEKKVRPSSTSTALTGSAIPLSGGFWNWDILGFLLELIRDQELPVGILFEFTLVAEPVASLLSRKSGTSFRKFLRGLSNNATQADCYEFRRACGHARDHASRVRGISASMDGYSTV